MRSRDSAQLERLALSVKASVDLWVSIEHRLSKMESDVRIQGHRLDEVASSLETIAIRLDELR